ncbi:MAG: tetratricopeptide repeat protein [Nanoarchaeota archaeon]|nr:tetratricopeptide repeat protein [Nanoarchaeota archaeon]MBU1976696.1 tetratricopeptide repeat protein [Nanoarchaeota archaeon]
MAIKWKSEKIEQDVGMLLNLLEKGSFTTEEANVQKMLVDSINREQGKVDDFQLLSFFCKAYDNFILSVADKIDLHSKEDYVLAEKIFEFGNKAIEFAPSDKSELMFTSFVYEAFADVYFLLDEYEKAIEYSSKVLKLRPNYQKPIAMIEHAKNLMGSKDQGSVTGQVNMLQAKFMEKGLKLYLQGQGESPPSSQMYRFTNNPPVKIPVGSEEVLTYLQKALSQNSSAMLMRTGDQWELFIESVEEKKKGGCFIATATFGSDSAEEVIVLCNFRDNILQRFSLGRKFISIYYLVSPSIANIISDSNVLRKLTSFLFVIPSAKIARLFGSSKTK